ncbi:MAG: hypothetical protein LBT80_08410 [Lactobacillaceae bacterium]|jgi:hypothetical protein|nr:hypothetical protein [Lactobacillaceae bacterium]
MRKKQIIITIACLASVGGLALGGLTNSQAQYFGARQIALQSDKVLELASGKYQGIAPKDGYYVIQLRGGDGGTVTTPGTGGGAAPVTNRTRQGGQGGYVEAIYKIQRGQTITLNVATAGTPGTSIGTPTGITAGGSNPNANDATGGTGGFSFNTPGWPPTTIKGAGAGGGGSTDLRIGGSQKNNIIAVAGGGGGAATGNGASNNYACGGMSGFIFGPYNNGAGYNGEDGHGFTGTNFQGKGASTTAAGGAGNSTTDNFRMSYAGTSGNGSNGGRAGAPTYVVNYTKAPNAGGGGGAGYFGGGGGNSAVSTYNGDQTYAYAGAGGGGSSIVKEYDDYVKTNLTDIFNAIKAHGGPNLANNRPNIDPTQQFTGGGANKPGEARIYYVGNTLPGTDNVGMYAVPMQEPKGSK